MTYAGAKDWIKNIGARKLDGGQQYKQRFYIALPISAYLTTTVEKIKKMPTPPIVYEIGTEFIGELQWYQKVITHTRQIYN
jgi:hypothetical protein